MAGLIQEPPLVGRQRDTELFKEYLERAFAGRGGIILVAGEAGIGKSRLAEEFSKIVTGRGCRTLIGRCLPGTPAPYLPFQDALKMFPAKDLRAGHLGLLGWLRGPGITQSKEGHRATGPSPTSDIGGIRLKMVDAQTLHTALEFFREATAKQPLLLVLEDLHWADSASIQLLHFLARHIENLKVLLVGTYRPEDLLHQEGEQVHPFLEALRIMKREGVCIDLTLDPLSPDELRSAIEGMLRDRIDGGVLRKIESEGGGNPLFTVEIVRLLVETKSIVLRDDVWTSEGLLKIDIPSTVREVILRRLDRLSRNERRLMEWAAVIGEWFDPAVLAEALNLVKLHLLESLDSIERNSRLIRSSDGLYHFSHEKIQRTTYEQVSSPRRREMHRNIAEALEGRKMDESLYGQLSLHFLKAVETGKCLKYSLLAGQTALNRLAVPEAQEYFQRTLELAEGDPSLLNEKLQALEGLGDANAREGRTEAALRFYSKFLQLCNNPREQVRALRKCAENSYQSKVAEFLAKAEAFGEVDPVEIGRIKRIRSGVAAAAGKYAEAEALCYEARRLFEENNATEEVADTLLANGWIGLAQGRLNEASQKLKEASQLFKGLPNPLFELRSSILWGSIYLCLGFVKDALESWRRAGERAGDFGLDFAQFNAQWFRAFACLTVDDFESARLEALKAREHALKSESQYSAIWANLLLGQLEILSNRVVEGEKIIEEAIDLATGSGIVTLKDEVYVTPSDRDNLGYICYAQACLLSAKGDWSAANQKWLQVMQLFQGGIFGVWAVALGRVEYARYCLLRQGLKAEAMEQLRMAVEAFEKLGNATHAEKAKKIIEELS